MSIAELSAANTLIEGAAWYSLDGETLFSHIQSTGLEVNVDSTNEGVFVLETLRKKLNGHFSEVDVRFSTLADNPNQLVAQIALLGALAEV
jgi:phosphosulfolactate synthase (CoM biosynthesis protein A)